MKSDKALKYLRNLTLAALSVLVPLMGVLTYFALSEFYRGEITTRIILTLLIDYVLVLSIVALSFQQIARKAWKAKKSNVASPIHLRLTRVFVFVAFLPTAIVVVVATLAISVGLRDQLTGQLGTAFDTGRSAAAAYVDEKRNELEEDLKILADDVERFLLENPEARGGDIRQALQETQKTKPLDLKHVFVIDGNCEIQVRGRGSYKFNFEVPEQAVMGRIELNKGDSGADSQCSSHQSEGEVEVSGVSGSRQKYLEDTNGTKPPYGVLYSTAGGSDLRGIIRLDVAVDRFLFATKDIESQMLALHDSFVIHPESSEETVRHLGTTIFRYSVIYLIAAFFLLFGMIRLGSWFAERMSRPVEQLALAAEKVGKGNFDISVEVEGDDEIANVAREFNDMVVQIKKQRDELTNLHQMAQIRERRFHSVLANVTAGVMGLDKDRVVVFMNRSAGRLLHRDGDMAKFNSGEHGYSRVPVSDAFPEIVSLLEELESRSVSESQGQIRIVRRGVHKDLLVRVAARKGEKKEIEGYVVAFDDVSDLVRAESKAAWVTVAQRVAHEVKNPITPIVLSIKQINRRIGSLLDDEGRESLKRYTNTILENMNGLTRLSNEFSQFARLPDPVLRTEEVSSIVASAVNLESERGMGIEVEFDAPSGPIYSQIDKDLFRQALTNLLKNAAEALDEKRTGIVGGRDFKPQIRVELEAGSDMIEIRVMDNGKGFPEDRSKILEPFFTLKEGGTGLGLSNVQRIVQGHDGSLEIGDSPAFADCAPGGALVTIRIPRLQPEDSGAVQRSSGRLRERRRDG